MLCLDSTIRWSFALAILAGLTVANLLFKTTALQAAEPATATAAEREAFFEKQIRPLLVKHCQECHGADDQSGGLRLDSNAALRQGGDSGVAVVPGEPEQSRLIRGVQYNDVNFQMPPDGKLPEEAIAAFVAWVKLGAPWPASETPEPAVAKAISPAERIDEMRSEHWAYQPVVKPNPPSVQNEAWVQSPLDRFVLAKLESVGLQPNPQADRRTLIRRLYFDLIGLPPSYEEVEAFVADPSPDALAKVVDRLLDNPHYGERWARHWLDIARYSDTMGYMGVGAETRYPYAYTYRDWVIAAFNEDKPYNRFVIEQIAADKLELPPEDQSALAAMGFLNVGRRFLNKQNDIIDDQIDVVSRGFLGLTVSCARCHDHKFDPIPTADYYSLHGIFASSEEPEKLPLVGPAPDTPQYKEFQQGLAARQKKLADWLENLQGKVNEELRSRASDYLAYEARVLPQYNSGSEKQQGKSGYLRPAAIRRWHQYLADRQAEQSGVWQLWHALAKLPKDGFAAKSAQLLTNWKPVAGGELTPATKLSIATLQQDPAPRSMPEVAERLGKLLETTHVAWRESQKAEPRPSQLADAAQEELRQEIVRQGSPLVVGPVEIQSHFTQGERGEFKQLEKAIQAFEFSHPGAPPRAMVLNDKAQLYDPVIFRRGLPSNKGPHVPRRFLQVLSHVDGGAKFIDGSGRLELAEAIASDKNPLTPRVMVNRIWQHHFGAGLVRTPSDFGIRGERPTHPELLDWLAATFIECGWSIEQLHRTILLSATWQQASTHKPAAKMKDPENRWLWKMNRRRLEFEPLRDALLLTAGKLDLTIGGRSVNIHEGAARRGLYAFVDRQDVPGLLAAFDLPNPDATTAVRSETTVPQQALFLMNSPLILEQAKGLTARVQTESDSTQRIRQLYRLALARDPAADELALATRFVQPAEPVKRLAGPTSPWQFGTGHYDATTERLQDFKPLGRYTGKFWQASVIMPDSEFQYLQLTSSGGHPGGNDAQAAVRRWVAPERGLVSIRAQLEHSSEQGNGIQAWLVSSRTGELGTWIVKHGEAITNFERVVVERGETLDFVVAPRGEHSYDSFLWAPTIKLSELDDLGEVKPNGGGQWDAAADFAAASAHAPQRPALDRWIQLAQVLLLSNEFVFVD
jgi:mono/diheme cytochrome c family protein